MSPSLAGTFCGAPVALTDLVFSADAGTNSSVNSMEQLAQNARLHRPPPTCSGHSLPRLALELGRLAEESEDTKGMNESAT